jgi:hypothetical protein
MELGWWRKCCCDWEFIAKCDAFVDKNAHCAEYECMGKL